MIVGLLTGGFVLLAFILAFIILLQKGKSSLGLGGMGGGSQMLFGGSAGQEVFQKITWVLLAIFMFGSLSIAILKTKKHGRRTPNVSYNMPLSSSEDVYE